QRAWPRLRAVDIALLAAMVGIGLSLARSAAPLKTSQVFFDSYLIPTVVYFLARNLVRDRQWLDRAKFALVFVGFYLSALIIHEHFTGQALLAPAGDFATRYSQNLARSTAVFGNSAISGAFLAIIFPMAFSFLMVATSPRARLFLALTLPVIGLGLFFTYTRAAWLSTLIALIALQFFIPRLRRFLLPTLAVGVMAALALQDVLISNPVFSERITNEGPIQGRLSLLGLGLRFFMDEPLFGIGFDNFRNVSLAWRMTEIINTHNSFLFILVSSGLVGFLPYLAALALVCKEALRGAIWLASRGGSHLLAPLWVALISYLINAMVIDMVSAPYLNLVFFFLVGSYVGLLEDLRARDTSERRLAWASTSRLPAFV
ncbi:MAG: O-antigen ligase family protein, partial [Dehalococcoidia bacterium]|nr:O-antigen ligase family protein [Dehalococcoidia bacterium]